MKKFLLSAFLLTAFVFHASGQDKKTESAKFVGQIVCSNCWSEADRSTTPYGTEADLECAAMCAQSGIAQALAVRTFGGDTTLYLLEDGKYKHSGKNWLAFIAKNVEINGTVYEKDGKKFLAVDSLKVLPAEKKPIGKTKKS